MLVALGLIAALLLAIFYVCHLWETHHPMPENALVFLDDQAHTFHAPATIVEPGLLRLGTAGEAYRLKYTPDPWCNEEVGFTQQGRCAFCFFLECAGLLKPLPSRWNSDGTWKW